MRDQKSGVNIKETTVAPERFHDIETKANPREEGLAGARGAQVLAERSAANCAVRLLQATASAFS